MGRGGNVGFLGGNRWANDTFVYVCRTMLRRLARISMPGLQRWSRRAGGCQLATRRDLEISLFCKRSPVKTYFQYDIDGLDHGGAADSGIVLLVV